MPKTDDQKTISDLRLRIEQLRRQIDRRVNSSRRETRRATSLKGLTTRFPGSLFTTVFGAGLALALGLSGKRLFRIFGVHLMRRGLKGLGSGIRKEIEKEILRFWKSKKK